MLECSDAWMLRCLDAHVLGCSDAWMLAGTLTLMLRYCLIFDTLRPAHVSLALI